MKTEDVFTKEHMDILQLMGAMKAEIYIWRNRFLHDRLDGIVRNEIEDYFQGISPKDLFKLSPEKIIIDYLKAKDENI